jgi:holo-[acyl-carrier protein] synthase
LSLFRWAVKEAAYKALYPVVKPTWKELTYLRLREAKPTLEYCPMARDERSRVAKMHASVSHDGAYVFASVLAENAD